MTTSTEDQRALGVLDYQISKSLEQAVIEGVPAIVQSIDDATDAGDWGDVPVGHKFMTEDETLYRLPSGAHVEVTWSLVPVSDEEAKSRIAEMQE